MNNIPKDSALRDRLFIIELDGYNVDEKIRILIDYVLPKLLKNIGLKGIQSGSNINNKNLNEPEFFPIWQACQQLDLAVLVHPWNMMGKAEMENYWLPWLVGMPAETSRAICSIIFGGIFEKFPNLRVNFCHASGSFLSTLGRIEHGFNSRPDLVAIDNPINPKKYWILELGRDVL